MNWEYAQLTDYLMLFRGPQRPTTDGSERPRCAAVSGAERLVGIATCHLVTYCDDHRPATVKVINLHQDLHGDQFGTLELDSTRVVPEGGERLEVGESSSAIRRMEVKRLSANVGWTSRVVVADLKQTAVTLGRNSISDLCDSVVEGPRRSVTPGLIRPSYESGHRLTVPGYKRPLKVVGKLTIRRRWRRSPSVDTSDGWVLARFSRR